jgi:hypothetical protein
MGHVGSTYSGVALSTSAGATLPHDDVSTVCLSLNKPYQVSEHDDPNNYANASPTRSDQMVAEKVTTPSLEDVIAFGGIPCVNNSGVRTSSRIREQNDADDTQLARAMKNTEQRFASASGKKSDPPLSFISIPTADIIDRASRLGVSLGNNVDDATIVVNNMKKIEEERTIHILQKAVENNVMKDTGPSNLLMSKVSNLCEDLAEDVTEEIDDLFMEPIPIIKERKTRTRKVYDMSNVRKSTRKRTKKVY